MNSHRKRRARGFLALAFSLFTLVSCSGKLGWGILLWTSPDGRLPAGSLVPVYIRSNIEKLYVVGLPDSREKIELPLWSLELFRSKRAARERIAEFGEYLTDYLSATRDGLPVREEPSNASRRVYRLREGQSVKILAKVQGATVSTGGASLEGDWFQVLAEDGTRGFVFSNTMRRYDELVERPGEAAVVLASTPGRLDLLFSRSWRPDYFQEMLDEGRLDLDIFSQRFGLFADAVRRQIRIELPAVSKVFNYSSIAEEGGAFLFEDTELRIRFQGEGRLLADWSGGEDRDAELAVAAPAALAAQDPEPAQSEDPRRIGSDSQANFAAISVDIREAVRAEESRRQSDLDALLDKGASWILIPPSSGSLGSSGSSAGASGSAALGSPEGSQAQAQAASALPSLPPSGPSRFVLSRGKRFSWTSINLVPPGYLPVDLGAVQEGRASGEADIRLSLSPALSPSWEGALSLRFDGARGWADFLYRHAGGKLELLPVSSGARLEATNASALEALVFERAD